jgi:hypothetical protein
MALRVGYAVSWPDLPMAAMQQGGLYKEVRITVSSSPAAVGRKTIARSYVEEECCASNWSKQSERCLVAYCIIEKYISSCCTIILQSVCSQVSLHLSRETSSVFLPFTTCLRQHKGSVAASL